MLRFDPDIIPVSNGAYIVGGSIRDLLLGRSPTDYDIAVLGNPEKFARKIAARTNGRVVVIGKPDQKIIRVVSANNIFDVAPVNGPSIESDLKKRDFTINAMAYTLSSREIIDVSGGMRDLSLKKVRMVSADIFNKDPIRLIRAHRLGAFLDFRIDPQTISEIQRHALLIRKSAGERIRAELIKLMGTSHSHRHLSQMAESELLFAIFPELVELKGCRQNKYHGYDVFEHTLSAYYQLEKFISNFSTRMPEIELQMNAFIENSKSVLLKFAILLHDTGKPPVRTIDDKGDVHFYGHAGKSAAIAEKIASRLKLSNRENLFLDFIIRNHLTPLSLFAEHRKENLTQKGLTRFFIKCGDNTPYLLLHALADTKGKGRKENEAAFMVFAKDVLQYFLSNFKPDQSKPPLLTGYDLINEFNLNPAPVFKKILRIVEEARFTHKINTRQEALKLVEKLLQGEDSMPAPDGHEGP